MDEVEFIKKSLEHDLEYWEKAEKENPDNSFYSGAVAALKALKENVKFLF